MGTPADLDSEAQVSTISMLFCESLSEEWLLHCSVIYRQICKSACKQLHGGFSNFLVGIFGKSTSNSLRFPILHDVIRKMAARLLRTSYPRGKLRCSGKIQYLCFIRL